jgi:hypothetical protein
MSSIAVAAIAPRHCVIYRRPVTWPRLAVTGMAGVAPTLVEPGAVAVPLYRLLQNSAFDPDTVAAMSAAFEETCRMLGLAERTDPLCNLVAQKILDCARTGERDPNRLRECALKAINA